MSGRGRVDPQFLDEVKGRTDLEGLIGRRVALARKGPRMVGLCPFHAEKTPSFTVNGAEGSYHCFGCGAHGDAIKFVMLTEEKGFHAAVAALAAEVGLASPSETPEERAARLKAWAREKAEREAEARRLKDAAEARRKAGAGEIWRMAARDLVLTRFLNAEGIDTGLLAASWGERCPDGVPASLRFLADCPDFEAGRDDPAMVAVMQDEQQRFRGVHRTFLTRHLDAERAFDSKKMLGVARGAVVRLTAMAPVIHLCEGIKTGLAVMMILAQRGETAGASVFAALSLGNIGGEGWGALPDMQRPGFIPPPGCERIVIWEDNDSKDAAVADAIYARAAARFAHRARLGVARTRPPRGMDFRDLVRAAA